MADKYTSIRGVLSGSLSISGSLVVENITIANGGALTSGSSGTSGTNGTSGTDGVKYVGNSTTSFTLGTGDTITVETGLSFTPGQTVVIAKDGENYQESVILVYNSGNGSLQFDTPSNTVGSGTYSSWTVNLAGAPGLDGSSGVDGTAGSGGTSGTDGTAGSGGTSGVDGTAGSGGTSGVDGTSGSGGTSGVDGTSGTGGSSGTSTSIRVQTTTADKTIGLGEIVFGYTTTSVGWITGNRVRATYDASNWVEGVATAVSSTATTIDVDLLQGSGTYNLWYLTLAGQPGESGTNGTGGTSGVDGTNGTAGSGGTSGENGTNGTAGSGGTSGVDGTNGTAGSGGTSGVDGTNGTAGSGGTSGTSGLNGDKYASTSTTSNDISTGTKTFTIGTGLQWTPGQAIVISQDSSNKLEGVVVSYDSEDGSLEVNITTATGSGSGITSWFINTAGAPGQAGSSGTSGSGGTNGTAGSGGTSGVDGTNGTAGSGGTSGVDGTNGTGGTSGTDGTGGTSGIDGTNGTDGVDGTNGSDGVDGTNGTAGSGGTSGQDGTNGTAGSGGTSGVDGTNGTAGSGGTSGADGTNGTAGSGGTSGTDGVSFIWKGTWGSGTSYQTNDVVLYLGDVYIAIDASTAKEPADFIGTAWDLFVSSGDDGTSGTDGTAGSGGTSGVDGTNGTAGSGGTSGVNGTNGTAGSGGTSGQDGTDGTAGSGGTSGTNGTSGIDGVNYVGSSTTSFTLGTADTIVVETGLSYTTAQTVIIAHDASNYQESAVVSYNSGTGDLQFGTPSNTVGSGTYDSWTVNLAGAPGASGTDGTSGSGGTSGVDGTNGTAGSGGTSGESFTWRDEWVVSTNYNINDVVFYQGNSYICTDATNVGKDPISFPGVWSIMTQKGTNGTAGSGGTSGQDGTDGTAGSGGTSGQDGTNGTAGSGGTSGQDGTNGTAGSGGTSGVDGTNGTNGTDGVDGTNGTAGSGGTSGVDGTNGTDGVDGTNGTAGSGGTSGVNGTSFRWQQEWQNLSAYSINDVVFYQGSSYIALSTNSGKEPNLFPGIWSLMAEGGTNGTSGSGGTSGVDGTNGTAGSGGVDGTNGTAGSGGTSGVDGTNGTAGSGGVDGTNGTAGSGGTSGVDGTNGTAGSGGTSGEDGTNGTAGSGGTSGQDGTNGTDGVDGTNGTAGSGGTSGVNGTNGTAGSGGTSGTSFFWQGDYNSGTTYKINDIVVSNGGVYISLQTNNTSNDPASSPSFWQLMVQNGDNGTAGSGGTSGINGTNGTAGSGGTSGTDGATGTSFIWRDVWDSGTSYNLNDVVHYQGSSYICVDTPNTGKDPVSFPSVWEIVAEKGDNGTNGTAGSGGTSGTSGGSTNIYNSDGTISEPRIVEIDGEDLAFEVVSGGSFTMNGYTQIINIANQPKNQLLFRDSSTGEITSHTTASFAMTGSSNTFYGNQTITGSLKVKGDTSIDGVLDLSAQLITPYSIEYSATPTAIIGKTEDEKALGTPDTWIKITIDGQGYLIPGYQEP